MPACWSTPSTPGRRCGGAGPCRRCSFRATTGISNSGAGPSPWPSPAATAPTCGPRRSSPKRTKSFWKSWTKRRNDPRRRISGQETSYASFGRKAQYLVEWFGQEHHNGQKVFHIAHKMHKQQAKKAAVSCSGIQNSGMRVDGGRKYAIMKSNPKYFAPVRPIFCGGRSPLYQFCRRVNLHVC